jgi:hypothetical protein
MFHQALPSRLLVGGKNEAGMPFLWVSRGGATPPYRSQKSWLRASCTVPAHPFAEALAASSACQAATTAGEIDGITSLPTAIGFTQQCENLC